MVEQANDEEPIGAGRELDRIIFFSDAVFAIAVTLLVLDIRVPNIPPNLVAGALPAALAALWPKFIGYLISFALIGMYCWQMHHRIFRYIVKYDEHLLSLNLLLLLCVAFLPFSVSLINQYGGQRLALAIYLGNLALVGLLLVGLLWYAQRHNLTDPALARERIMRMLVRGLTLPVVCLFAFVLSYLHPLAALLATLLFIPTRALLTRLLIRRPARVNGKAAAP